MSQASSQDDDWSAIEMDQYLTHIWRIVDGRLAVAMMVSNATAESLRDQIRKAEEDLQLLCQFGTAKRLKGRV
jgi:hypothetical protein